MALTDSRRHTSARSTANFCATLDEPFATSRTSRTYRAGRVDSLGNLHEPLLDKLDCSRHCIRIHLDAMKKIGVSLVVNLRGRAAQLYPHAMLLQIRDKLLVGISGRDISVGVVSGVVQSRMAGVRGTSQRCRFSPSNVTHHSR
jgi:hypothetical protein